MPARWRRDDEAHGGHFAVVTGRVQADSSIGNWLVNNFYSLDVESEKGILAAPQPPDNYLGDLNLGQGWYRPTTMVVAVLADEHAAALVQSALNRVFNQFYATSWSTTTGTRTARRTARRSASTPSAHSAGSAGARPVEPGRWRGLRTRRWR